MTSSSLTLLIYLVVLLPLMLLGFFFARRKLFSQHKQIMTTVVVLNWVLIAVVMVGSYRDGVLPGIPDSLGDIRILIPVIHGLTGLVAQLMATYLVLLMLTENTALEKLVFIRISNVKTPMRITLTVWIITVLLGFGIFATWYGGSSDVDQDSVPSPVVTEDVDGAVDSDDATTDSDDAVPEPDTTEEADN